MQRGPITARTGWLAAACLLLGAALGGCENRYNTSFVLQPGGSARFSAQGDRAFAVIRNRGPSQIIATFSADGVPPAVKEIPANTMHGEAIKKKTVTLLGGTAEAVVDIDVQNAEGFLLNLSPTSEASGTAPAK